jgi:transcriptional regulator with XRE-family HTH domain
VPFCYVHRRGRKPRPAGYREEPKALADHLRKRRIDLGLLQREVADQVGVTVETVLGWELRAREPAVLHWPAILAFLGFDPYPEPRTTAECLKAVRRRRGWSQRGLAKSLHVDPATVQKWEIGKGRPWEWRGAELTALLLVLEAAAAHPDLSIGGTWVPTPIPHRAS